VTRPCGTSLFFELQLPRFPSRVAAPFGRDTEQVFRDFDPIARDDLPYAIAELRDRVREVAEYCLCPIVLDGEALVAEGVTRVGARFDRETRIELWIEAASANATMSRRTFYRGAGTDDRVSWPLLSVGCNVCASNASRFLELNREKLSSAGAELVSVKLRRALRRQLPSIADELRASRVAEDSTTLAIVSLYLHLFGGKRSRLAAREEWKGVALPVLASSPYQITLGELLACNLVTIFETKPASATEAVSSPWGLNVVTCRDGHAAIEILGHEELPNWLWRLLRLEFSHTRYEGTRNLMCLARAAFPRNMSKDGLRRILWAAVRDPLFRGFGRASIPCPTGFDALALRKEVWLRGSIPILAKLQPRTISPFVSRDGVISTPNLSKLIPWIARHSARAGCTEHDVADQLLRLIRLADRLMRGQWGEKRGYRIGNIRAELEQF
jgi:hypothetical protein